MIENEIADFERVCQLGSVQSGGVMLLIWFE
jgi:hypothetical protein